MCANVRLLTKKQKLTNKNFLNGFKFIFFNWLIKIKNEIATPNRVKEMVYVLS